MAKKKTVVAIKGFNRDWTCRGHQYAPDSSYKMDGKPELCERGFHACHNHPLDVLGYYAPNQSRFAEVELSGEIVETDDKAAATRIKVGVEIELSDLIARAVKWVFDRAKPATDGNATGDQGAASATGDQGAASATGDRGAASATGDRGAASATGYRGAASATGDQGAAMACGYEGRAAGRDGCALFLAERDYDYNITHVWAGIVGRDGIKPDTFYMLRHGEPEEVK